MKMWMIAILLLLPPSLMAETTKGTADWVTETSTMLVEGVAAKDLYQSLKAPEKLDPLSSNWDQYRTKKNDFAECGVSFYRKDTPGGDPEWIMQDNASCKIQAPAGTADNQ